LAKKAYGESKPLNDNSTPELRDVNRRVDFLVLDVQ
jgi:flagellar motor protein MotB